MNNIDNFCIEMITKRISAYKKRNEEIDWHAIRTLRKSNEEDMRNEILVRIYDGELADDTTLEDYQRNCDFLEDLEKNSISCIERSNASIIVDTSSDNFTQLDVSSKSAWSSYKKKLSVEKHFSDLSIAIIEKETEKIRKRLTTEYIEEVGAIKGVVVGAVQSGKTANMGALIAQCADSGWNMFIILGGMIENLRSQTEDRLIKDLSGDNYFNFISLSSICQKKPDTSQELCNINLKTKAKEKYLCFALKNKDRLENMIKWIKRDTENAKNLKVLVIDDEADQASVNTGDITKEEKKKIYALIDELVNGTKENGQLKQLCGAMNYICYTATPYANFLNDSDLKSLYPNNFIATLTPSNSYFGPQQIFGISEEGYDGLSIIRKIDLNDKDIIDDIYEYGSLEMPSSLEESLLWFMCVLATMRYKDVHKPFSMLINASPKTDHHECIANVILEWFTKFKIETIIKKCKVLWEREIHTFSLSTFKDEFPQYDNINKIEDYPSFEEIKPFLYSLIEERANFIKVNENNQFEYCNGIHICVDNCKNNKITLNDEYLRLIYPNKQQLDDNPAIGFIVIGGNTLSRGLTIEGLVSTFFLRNGRQADSLMQMGRWFGYRFGYELYPRIWMDDKTVEQFEFISQLDYDLRLNLNKYMTYNASPRDVGPLINNTPAVSWLRITAKNKSQSAIIDCESYDYTGIQAQTISFDEDLSLMQHNINCTKSFLNNLNEPKKSRSNNSYVWKKVDVKLILNYLNEFKFCNNNRIFSDISIFNQWLEKKDTELCMKEWNVVLAGVNSDNDPWSLNDKVKIIKVTRSRKSNIKDFINIGVLRSYRDNFEDITIDENTDIVDSKISNAIKETSKSADIFEIKKELKIEVRPMMVIYIIDKNPKQFKANLLEDSMNKREKLNLKEDLVGIYINVPGKKKRNPGTKLTINIKGRKKEEYSNED